MWKYCRKFAPIYGCSKEILKLGSFPSINIVTKACYYSDYIHSKDIPVVKPISECFIKPKYEVKDSTKPYHLGPTDLAFLPGNHIQIGFLYRKPEGQFSMQKFLTGLKESLSNTLVHFYPLAGRLVFDVDDHKHETRTYVDCNKGPGARLIHATLDISISDILLPNQNNHLVARSFFDLNEEVVNYDDHIRPLLCVQVTELLDGVFIACSANHCLVDGTSYWHFWSVWSEIHNRGSSSICESRLPVYNQWLLNWRNDFPIPLPFTHRDEVVRKLELPQFEERIFQFSSESIAKLKAKAVEEATVNNNNISSFQALCALASRSMIQANNLPDHNNVFVSLGANIRNRCNPPLPNYSFGNFIIPCTTITTAGELRRNSLGWAASLLHQSVSNLNDDSVRETVNAFVQFPLLYHDVDLVRGNNILIANSPRFDMYGHEFGLGKAVTFRKGYTITGNGLVFACPGFNGQGGVDLIIHLPIDSMDALESDQEFMSFASMSQ